MSWAEMIFARMKRGAHRLTTVGSATQLYTPLPFVVSRHYLIAGTAVGQNYQLPDARPCEPECVITLTNSSSEFVGICPSGSTTFLQRIPPRGVATFILTAAGTAAGTWSVFRPPMMGIGGYEETEHFELNSTRYASVQNGAGALSTGSIAPGTDLFGNWLLRCGTTAAGYAVLRGYAGATNLAIGPVIVDLMGKAGIVPTAAEDYIPRMGFGDDATGAIHATGLWAEVDRARAGTVNWWLVARNGGAETPVQSAIAITTDAQRIRIERARVAGRADLWIDRVYAASVTTNLPAGANYCGQIFKNCGVAYAANTRSYNLIRISTGYYPENADL